LLSLDKNGQTTREAQAIKKEAEGDFPREGRTTPDDTD
jgi:hypothetical protein